MELEKLQDELSESLVQLRCEQLQEVCSHAKIAAEKETKKHTLIRLISQAADTAVDDEEEEVASAFLVRLITTAKGIKERDEQSHRTDEGSASEDAAALASLQEQYAALQLSFEASTKKLEQEMTRLTNKVTTQQPSNVFLRQQITPIDTQPPEVIIRREFKINGQIGERGQKDKLSYSNLIHQINMGLKKKHSEAEIIEAVVRAISPGLNLRDMLEIKSDLTLAQLHTILKGLIKKIVPLTCTIA